MQSQTHRCRGKIMKDKVIEILVRLAHISVNLKSLTQEIDKMYDILGDNDFLNALEKELKK